MEHLDPDQIVRLALGEPADPADATAGQSPSDVSAGYRRHLNECAVCEHELAQLTRTVELARQAGELGLQAPVVLPASIWNGIAQELGIGGAPAAPDNPEQLRAAGIPRQPESADRTINDHRGQRDPGARAVGSREEIRTTTGRHATAKRPHDSTDATPPKLSSAGPRSWRRGLLIAAAIVAIAIGVTGGVAIGRRSTTVAQPPIQSEAVLAPMPAAPPSAHGTATVAQGSDGLTLNVVANQLPLRQGYYEVWLYDPTADKMVAVGTLGAAGGGSFTLASTIDLRSYSIVDVSAQDFDGNPAHKDSVLRGTLTQ